MDLANNCVLVPSEDGHVYRWNLAVNSLSEALPISPGVGQPYVPTVIGPDGTVLTLNGGTLFALGAYDGVRISLASSAPDMRNWVLGEKVTFTVTVSSTGLLLNVPTGSITFTDLTYNGLTPVTTVLADDIPLDASGQASVTTFSLAAGGNFLGNHRITASYRGDVNFTGGSAQRVQKVHAYTTTMSVACSSPVLFSQTVQFTATVSAGVGVTTGMVMFCEGSTILGQRPVNGLGVCSLTIAGLSATSHTITATYASDTRYAASRGDIALVVEDGTTTTLASGPNPSSFGQSVAFTARVAAVHVGAGIPTGWVTFKKGGTSLGTVAVNAAGKAVLNISNLTPGAHVITATFAGSNGWGNSSGNTVTHTVLADTTPPTIPGGLTASSGPARKQITLAWTGSPDASGIARYEVYQATTEFGAYTLISWPTPPTTSYIVTLSKSGQVRWYYVIAVDNFGNNSAASVKV
ncbi:MAG: hypothetical protein EXS36_04130 [Pedosphaera sp.]|nr:hypothetical protein [Pedosphaera sp.]